MTYHALEAPMCRECERPMALLGSWTGSVYVPPGVDATRPITSRHYLCEACRIPLRVEYCPAHQKRLVVPPLVPAPATRGGAEGVRRRPQRCPSPGCTYEKSRDEAPVAIR